MSIARRILAAAAACAFTAATAAPLTYKLDPAHTFPSFEADHMGISVWRGKMNRSSGQVVYDKATGAGQIEVAIELGSIDFGHDQLNAWARGDQFFDTTRHATATYKGRFDAVVDGRPTRLVGELTMRGVTRPVTLAVHSLRCIPHPILKRELCGADASGSFQRDDFGLAAGKDWGFKMDVQLRIQAEAVAEQ